MKCNCWTTSTLRVQTGKHECHVLEFRGPNITDVLDLRFNDGRLPVALAKSSVQQALYLIYIVLQQLNSSRNYEARKLGQSRGKMESHWGLVC
ncbi:hypothetical protein BDW02DRAFT_566273 [Decorospora gaudefroyi]|uniref:Uncharacterized protein n=1 Tax=Decorospora gaudefroyi TaxID=184978 RepID=A0A6A5KM57_9PLEO|nr:hypothetical protein BDW02DRAFT_566273 [Decorospora gaudefroyi]